MVLPFFGKDLIDKTRIPYEMITARCTAFLLNIIYNDDEIIQVQLTYFFLFKDKRFHSHVIFFCKGKLKLHVLQYAYCNYPKTCLSSPDNFNSKLNAWLLCHVSVAK